MQEDNNFNANNEENKTDNQNGFYNQHSSDYSSENYHSDSYTYNDNTVNFEPEKAKRKSLKVSTIVFSLTVAVLIFILFTALLSYMIVKINGSMSNEVDLSGENLTIVKNSPKIDLTQNSDVDYEPKSIAEVVQKIGNSVVEISTSSVVRDNFYHQYVTSGAGSGVIITQSEKAGYLLTNNHVIDGAESVLVRLTNGDEYEAQVLGTDASNDLAVLRIIKNADEVFTVAPLGDSSTLAVGQEVIAIGNPLGSLGGTVTDGIISALDRTVKVDNVSMVLLQHNAAINPGNSGGGLFDAMGNLIGIVNAKTSETGIEGLGFAIPINIAHDFFNKVMITEPSLGIKVKWGTLNKVVGMYVIDAENSSGFEKYDRIVSINGKEILTEEDYSDAVGDLELNEKVTVVVERIVNKTRKQFKISFVLQ